MGKIVHVMKEYSRACSFMTLLAVQCVAQQVLLQDKPLLDYRGAETPLYLAIFYTNSTC